MPIIEDRCIVHTRPDGGTTVTVVLQEDRRVIEVAPEERDGVAVQAGKPITVIARLSDGTYAEREIVPQFTGLMNVRVKAPVLRLESDDEMLDRVLRAIPPASIADGTAPAIILRSNVPNDRSYRNGWMHEGGMLKHNMPKCRALHRDKIREARKPMLEALDVEFMRALGAKDQAAADAVEAQRQKLRDAPADSRIDAARTIDELKAIPLPEL